MAREEVVSSADEPLILVDENDEEIGARLKRECHEGRGILHRAFSVFVFNDDDELLLQQRSPTKPLWPEYWSNTCCSHPRVGETVPLAVSRRLFEELGFDCPVEFLYKFKYQAQYGDIGAEHEYCWVFYGRHTGPVDVNTNEIADWRFIAPAALDAELADSPERFTPWFKMEWEHISDNYLDRILGPEPARGGGSVSSRGS